ncbi:pilus assembly protein PilM [Vibrio alfacsensis]|uniref:type IV pilus biogenesis protein PilM n=1 Tax=Vibrio alfacsensis TaxID=1074311 RepID=UPI001BF09292|nr:type IV pilus assembly protein PilM [Vibrio alfacsensis]BBM63621.1 pilus assembly protein PilM [Vibrio alfacsensis]
MDKLVVTGIDIGHNSLKAVVLKPSGRHYAVLDYKEIILKECIVAENNTINHQEIVKTLKEIKKALPFGAKRVAISVPENAVISKKLQIDPGLDSSERDYAVMQVFAHQSPFPLQELSLDFVLDDVKNKTDGLEHYQVFATRKDVVDSRVDALQQSGLKPVLVEVASQSLGHMWKLATEHFPEKSTYCLLNVGNVKSSFTMFTEQGELFHKEFSSSSWSEKTPSVYQKGACIQVDESHQEQALIERVQRQLQLYASFNGSLNITGIWITGDGFVTPQLKRALSSQLSMECETLNPFELFTLKASLHKHKAVQSHQFTAAAGLAIRGIHWLEHGNVVSH